MVGIQCETIEDDNEEKLESKDLVLPNASEEIVGTSVDIVAGDTTNDDVLKK